LTLAHEHDYSFVNFKSQRLNMKTISLSEFKALIASDDWQRQQKLEVIDELTQRASINEMNDTDERVEALSICGCASKASTLNGITITYNESFNYFDCKEDSFSASTDGQDDIWQMSGASVIDDDGDELSADDLSTYLSHDFSNIDYSTLSINDVINIDVDDKQDIIEIEIDYAPDVRFCGSLLAYAADSCETSSGSNYSGDPARWTELRLYKTNNGKLICHRTNCTQWANEKDQYSGKVCENTDEVVGFFGYSRIAKELYAEANIASAFEVN